MLAANGAGKTTLFRACSGLSGGQQGAVASGMIQFDGVRIERAKPASVVRRGLAR